MAGAAFNVGGDAGATSVNRLLELIAAECGVRPDPVHAPGRAGDVRTSEADVSLARELIGFRPAVGIEEGVARTVAWFRDRVEPGRSEPPSADPHPEHDRLGGLAGEPRARAAHLQLARRGDDRRAGGESMLTSTVGGWNEGWGTITTV